jgi:long-chain-fatty-acid--CoA ligase ACSBG
MHNGDATRGTFDTYGWLHRGELGRVDANGFLHITGRIKELIITAGGENVPPVLIENEIKSECDAISNAVVIGDARKYLTVLLTLKSEPDGEGAPTTTPTVATAAFLKQCGSAATTTSAAAACEKVAAALTAAIKRANTRATSNAQCVQRFTVSGVVTLTRRSSFLHGRFLSPYVRK